MTARTLARLQAYGRVVLGGGLVAAPGLVAGGWVGGIADRREGQALAIGLGARDVGLALGTLRALSSGRGASAWLRAGVLADAADLAATLRARDTLPPLAVPAVATIAGGSNLLGLYLQSALDEPLPYSTRDQMVCSVRATSDRSASGSRPMLSVR
jgi:hypothetical protein